ncbi:MAG TPA: AIM24 family protein [Thermoleophilaceae bacterium]
MNSSLAEFKETQSQDAFTLQNPRLLKVRLEEVTIQARLGSMVAYQGDVHFEHAGSGGMKRMLKKMATGEGVDLMKVSGSGEVFLALQAEHVHLIPLNDEEITCNGQNVLAFDAGIDWDIKSVEGLSGVFTGGFFNIKLKGTGTVAVVSDGQPVLLETGGAPTFCDPQAAIVWSQGVTSQVKTDASLKSFVGFGSGETVQVAFSGDGWVLVQPSEGRVEQKVAGNQSGGGLGGMLSNLGG